ncbi:MAG TPA: HAMP domain-containing protein, partial [Candidatus Omnitrophota bacterium]|nr:HAMP domain-containing protein [Candidatus Omnitrophota bacterium]
MHQPSQPESQAVPGQSTKRWRMGVRAQLLVAIVAIGVMTLGAAFATWRSYSEIEILLATVTRGNLPSVSSALKLSEATARLAAAAPALDVSQTQFQRQSNFIALQQQSERLRGLIESLEGNHVESGQLDELRGLMAAIGDNVLGRNALVDRRIVLAERMRSMMAEVEEMDDDVHKVLERRHGDPSVASLVNAIDLMRSIMGVPTVDRLAAKRRAYDEEARKLVVLVEGSDRQIDDAARQAIGMGSGPENVFEVRAQQLLTESRLAAANEEGRDLVARTSSVVGRLVAAAESEASANEARAEDALTQGRRILLLIALGTFLGPLLFVWIYVGRNIVVRMAGVAQSMHRIVAGDYATPIARSGNDEISDMADALVVFRDAMAQLRESSAALRSSEQRLRTILDTSPLALAISRASDNRLLYVNPRWRETYGLGDAEAVGRDA